MGTEAHHRDTPGCRRRGDQFNPFFPWNAIIVQVKDEQGRLPAREIID
jgi:hypothetical protein